MRLISLKITSEQTVILSFVHNHNLRCSHFTIFTSCIKTNVKGIYYLCILESFLKTRNDHIRKRISLPTIFIDMILIISKLLTCVCQDLYHVNSSLEIRLSHDLPVVTLIPEPLFRFTLCFSVIIDGPRFYLGYPLVL